MTITHLITANELEAMGSDARFELIQGVLHEMSPSSYSSNIVLARIGAWLFTFVEQHRLGQVTFAEAGFILEESPDSVVAPDVAFVRQDRVQRCPSGKWILSRSPGSRYRSSFSFGRTYSKFAASKHCTTESVFRWCGGSIQSVAP